MYFRHQTEYENFIELKIVFHESILIFYDLHFTFSFSKFISTLNRIVFAWAIVERLGDVIFICSEYFFKMAIFSLLFYISTLQQCGMSLWQNCTKVKQSTSTIDFKCQLEIYGNCLPTFSVQSAPPL